MFVNGSDRNEQRAKHSYIPIVNFLDVYKVLNLCLCSHHCIKDVMMQRMQVSKFKRKFSTLHMGQKKFYVWDISN
jgi:hypothetical protein